MTELLKSAFGSAKRGTRTSKRSWLVRLPVAFVFLTVILVEAGLFILLRAAVWTTISVAETAVRALGGKRATRKRFNAALEATRSLAEWRSIARSYDRLLRSTSRGSKTTANHASNAFDNRDSTKFDIHDSNAFESRNSNAFERRNSNAFDQRHQARGKPDQPDNAKSTTISLQPENAKSTTISLQPDNAKSTTVSLQPDNAKRQHRLLCPYNILQHSNPAGSPAGDITESYFEESPTCICNGNAAPAFNASATNMAPSAPRDFGPDSIRKTVAALQRHCNTILNAHSDRAEKLAQIHSLQDTLIHSGLRSNFAGIDNGLLYTTLHLGASDAAIDHFIRQVEFCLDLISNSDLLTPLEKAEFFKTASLGYGRTALCFSGGAGFAMYHLGVLKALIDADMLPMVISGASAGALIAAFVCVRTEEELRRVFVPELPYEMFRFSNDRLITILTRFCRTGAAFSAEKAMHAIKPAILGDMTFLEAYTRTGRILNISVAEVAYGSSHLLNYKTAPDVLISSAIVASAALPCAFNPTKLVVSAEERQKSTTHGVEHSLLLEDQESPADPPSPLIHSSPSTLSPLLTLSLPSSERQSCSSDASPKLAAARIDAKKWRDGSIQGDVPSSLLTSPFNVKYSIVSQVNPLYILLSPHEYDTDYHIHPAIGNPCARPQGLLQKFASYTHCLELLLKLDIKRHLELFYKLFPLPVHFKINWSRVTAQRLNGTVTISPRHTKLSDYLMVFCQPTRARIKRMMADGERACWPTLHMIGNRMRIEMALNKARALHPVLK